MTPLSNPVKPDLRGTLCAGCVAVCTFPGARGVTEPMMLAQARTRIPIRESTQDVRDIHFDLIPRSFSSDLRPMARCMGRISGLDIKVRQIRPVRPFSIMTVWGA